MRRQIAVPLALTLAAITSVEGATLYSIVDLGVTAGDAIHAHINNRGHVVFSIRPENDNEFGSAYLFDGYNVTELRSPGASAIREATGINDHGTITGLGPRFFETSTAVVHQYGASKPLGPIGERGGIPVAINNYGHIVGQAFYRGSHRAFAYYSPSQIADLGTFGGTISSATDINDLDQIVGTAQISDGNNLAFLYDDGVMTNLGTLGGFFSGAAAINDLGVIVGGSDTVDRLTHAFIYHPSYGMRDIDNGNFFSDASDINNHNVVVGRAGTSLRYARAFVFDQVNGMRFLDELVSRENAWSHLSYATGINDRGQIVGLGEISGEVHAFLATPIPEPSTLLAVALFASLTVLRRVRS
jgi:probable HAF family extracellular repeat protein